MARGRH